MTAVASSRYLCGKCGRRQTLPTLCGLCGAPMPLVPIVSLVTDTMPPPGAENAPARRAGAPRALPASFSESIFVAPPGSAAPPPTTGELDAVLRTLAGDAVDAIAGRSRVARVSLRSVEREIVERVACGWGRVDDVLGGGIPMRRVVLLGGLRGSGKTSVTLPIAGGVARATGRPALYVSAEGQNAGELAVSLPPSLADADIRVLETSDIEEIESAIEEDDPSIVVVDSMQSVPLPGLRVGGDEHARAMLGRYRTWAREGYRCVWALSQMTKEGTLRGSEIYQQLCDTVLMMVRDEEGSRRVLKVDRKNRGGPDDRAAPFAFDAHGVLRGVGGDVE